MLCGADYLVSHLPHLCPMQPQRCRSPRHTQSCTRFPQRWFPQLTVPAALAAAPQASSGCLPLSLSLPVLDFLSCKPSRHRHCDLALRPQSSPCAHLPTGSTLQRVVPAYPMCMALLCPGSRGRFLCAMGFSHTFFSAFQLLTPSFSLVGYSSSD